MGVFLIMTASGAVAQNGDWVEQFDIKQYQGKVVYLDFWASWCRPCRKSFPWLNSLKEKYQDKGLVIIGINLDKDLEKAHNFLKQTPAHFKLFADPKGSWADHYKLIGMPSSLVLDGNGEVRHRHVGFKKSIVAQYEGSIESLLSELKGKH